MTDKTSVRTFSIQDKDVQSGTATNGINPQNFYNTYDGGNGEAYTKDPTYNQGEFVKNERYSHEQVIVMANGGDVKDLDKMTDRTQQYQSDGK